MEELKIYKFQLEEIQNTLRLAIRIYDSNNKETQTAFDRMLLKSKQYVDNALNKDIDK